jgi:hypothetical protein
VTVTDLLTGELMMVVLGLWTVVETCLPGETTVWVPPIRVTDVLTGDEVVTVLLIILRVFVIFLIWERFQD